MSKNLTFETLTEADIPSIREIIEGFMAFNYERIKSFISEKRNIALIAKLNGTAIGYAGWYIHRCVSAATIGIADR